MSHHHSHENSTRNITVAFYLNALFVVIEIIGGILTNSIAILSDALHDFGDCISLGIAWLLQKKSKQGRDSQYSYGYKRFSLLGSIFLSGILTVSSIIILIEATKRIMDPQPVNAQGMLWLAIVGIVINGAAALRLKKGSSLNERAVFLHILEDVLGWIAVLVVSIVMNFVDLPILDPILSSAIGLWVLFNVYKNLRDTFKVLLQGTPENIDLQELSQQIESIEGVESIHDLHLWSMDGETHVMTLHAVTSTADTELLKTNIRNRASSFKIYHTTIETENPQEECHDRCD